MSDFKHSSLTKKTQSGGSVILYTIIIGLILLGLGRVTLGYGLPRINQQITSVIKSSVGVIGETIGTEIEEDTMGQLSVLLVGVGGKGHRGSYNTDTMMVASYNPKTKAVTFISIPRDLYVNINNNRNGRINAVLNGQLTKGETLTGALSGLTQKVSSIMGISINHYLLVDFEGFEKMIDTLGGISVTVPKTIIDPTYPADEMKTMVLTINSGTQTMNGDMALKYARSRHSTSDFDRSLRQQQIIQGVIKQLLGGGLFKINELSQQFSETITTDLSISQIIGLSKYLNRIDHYFSFVLQSNCDDYYKLTQAGCLLYAPDRSSFGGAAILLPQGASAGRISVYDKIQQFAYYTVYQQQFLIEKPRILLRNGIDKTQLLGGQNPNGITSKLATDLVTYGFTVEGIGNNSIKSVESSIITLGTGSYDTTIQLLQEFIPGAIVSQSGSSLLSGTVFSGSKELPFDSSMADIVVVLGNNYLNKEKKQIPIK